MMMMSDDQINLHVACISVFLKSKTYDGKCYLTSALWLWSPCWF